MPKKKKKNVEEVLLDGAGAVLDFFQPGEPKQDLEDLVGDQSNKNRKPPFDLI